MNREARASEIYAQLVAAQERLGKPLRVVQEIERQRHMEQVKAEKVVRLNQEMAEWRRQQAIDAVWEQTLRERERQARVDAGPMTPTDPMGLWNGQR